MQAGSKPTKIDEVRRRAGEHFSATARRGLGCGPAPHVEAELNIEVPSLPAPGPTRPAPDLAVRLRRIKWRR